MTILKLDNSMKSKPFYFSDGENNLTENYTLKQALFLCNHYRQLGVPYENKTDIFVFDYNK
jgi:hypothetical protein